MATVEEALSDDRTFSPWQYFAVRSSRWRFVEMAMLFVRHKADDYAKWKSVYDGTASLRKERGVTAASVYRDPDDPNTIIVTHQFENISAAREFAGSEKLKSAMARAGVSGPPTIWFGEDVEKTPY
jgi:quinol monooxygenase YgiN